MNTYENDLCNFSIYILIGWIARQIRRVWRDPSRGAQRDGNVSLVTTARLVRQQCQRNPVLRGMLKRLLVL